MATLAQIRANRENAKKSTGPRTPEGKAASRRNSLRHGLCADQLLLPPDDPDDFLALRDDLRQRFCPVGEAEDCLVDRIAATQWRLLRSLPLEAQIYRERIREIRAARPAAADAAPQPESELLGSAFLHDCQGANALAKLARYESSLERSIDRSLRQLQRFQSARAQNPAPDENTERSQSEGTAASQETFLSPHEVSLADIPSYTQAPTEALNIAIAGPARPDYSRVTVHHQAHLDGALHLTLLAGYLPELGQTFTILTAAQIAGQFQSIQGLEIQPDRRFQIAYSRQTVTLTVLPVA